jgi:alkylmercury lyase-like protein
MTAHPSQQPATPDELEARLAHLGLPARGATDRQATLPAPLRAFHRRLLGAFLTQAGPPGPAVVARLAAELGLDPRAALAALAAADVVHTDPATGRISVAYPFSGRPTPHRVELAGGPTVYAMCALDALGIPQMTRRDGRIASTDPSSGRPITVEVHDGAWRFAPATTVVLAATAGSGDACGAVADCCCPYINFHADPHAANAYRTAHPSMAAELLSQAEALEAARRIFGGLLDPDAGRGPVRPPQQAADDNDPKR